MRLKFALIFCSAAVTCATAQYTQIPPSSLTATAENYYDGRPPINAVNGLGLDANGKHSVDQNQMWMGLTPSPYARWFRVDLGAVTNLGAIKIWNFNMNNGASFANRGVKVINIHVATAGGAGVSTGAPVFTNPAWTRIASNHAVGKAPGNASYTGDPLFTFTVVPARWVAFEILSLHDEAGNQYNGYAGLSEVQFFTATVEEGSALLASNDATDIGSTFATLPVEISAISGSGTLRVYYGPENVGAQNWPNFVEYPADVSTAGTYAIHVSGLTCGETVYYCHGIEINGTVTFSGTVRSFTPYINVTSREDQLAASATTAQLPADVTLTPGDSGVLRVYYGPSDGGTVPDNWLAHADSPSVSQSGTYAVSVAGLAHGQTYRYRHAFVTAANDICFATASHSFVADVKLESRAAVSIGSTFASLPAYFPVIPDAVGTLRVYCGTTDGGNTENWSSGYMDYVGMVDAPGVYSVPVSGLTLGVEYFFRHAFVATDGISYAPSSLSFTTADENQPATFAWQNATFPVVWSDAQWRNMSGLARNTPGVAGDTLDCQVTPRRSGVYYMTNDVTIGHIRAGFSDNSESGSLSFYPPSTPPQRATVTLDPGNTATTVNVAMNWLGAFELGTYIAATRNALVFDLKAPLNFTKTNAGRSRFYIHSPVTGGTEAAPVPLTFDCPNGDYSALNAYLTNTNNTFRGDIFIGTPNKKMIRFYVGFYEEGRPTAYVADNRMLGDAKNRIFLRNGSWFITHNPSSTFHCSRAILGTGTIRSADVNRWYVEEDDAPRQIILTETAALLPGEGTAFGTLTFWGSSITLHPEAPIQIKLSATKSDALSFIARANSVKQGNTSGVLPGTINLNDAPVEFVQADPAEHIPSGTTWTFATVTYPGSTITGMFKSKTSHYKIEAHEDTSGHAFFTVTKLNSATLLIVR